MPKQSPKDVVNMQDSVKKAEMAIKQNSAYSTDQEGSSENKQTESKPAKKNQKNGASNLRQQLEKAKRKADSLEAEAKLRKEKTPILHIADDTMELVYTGKIAGASATRSVPIIKNDNVKSLIHLLLPVVAVMNAALKGHDLKEAILYEGKTPAKYDEQVVYKATPLAKAKYAYSELLSNPSVVEHLKSINDEAEKIFEKLGVLPKDLETYTKGQGSGQSEINNVNKLFRQVAIDYTSDDDSEQSIDKDITDD